MRKRQIVTGATVVSMGLLLALSAFFAKGGEFYLVSFCIILLVLIPFFYGFERRVRLRDLLIIGVMSSVAMVARIAFFAIPQGKPIVAIVMITGISLGPEAGVATGVLSAFLSNFAFGQGAHTPFQMVALGLVGLLAGVIFYGRKNLYQGVVIVAGVFLTFFVYGAIVDINSIFMLSRYPTWMEVASVYVAAVPMNLLHAIATALFLALLFRPIHRRLERVQKKYGVGNFTS